MERRGEKGCNWTSVFTGSFLAAVGLGQAGAVEVERSASVYAGRAHGIYRGLTGPSEVSVINRAKMERPSYVIKG